MHQIFFFTSICYSRTVGEVVALAKTNNENLETK
jgi:hypothetical protein